MVSIATPQVGFFFRIFQGWNQGASWVTVSPGTWGLHSNLCGCWQNSVIRTIVWRSYASRRLLPHVHCHMAPAIDSSHLISAFSRPVGKSLMLSVLSPRKACLLLKDYFDWARSTQDNLPFDELKISWLGILIASVKSFHLWHIT